jgi:hypothetical protein
MIGDTALQRLLYDPASEIAIAKTNGAPVPLGLFRNNGMAHISGVSVFVSRQLRQGASRMPATPKVTQTGDR